MAQLKVFSRKHGRTGWKIKEKALFDFINAKMPNNFDTTNDVKEAVDKEDVRSEMWWELVHKNIFEDYIEPKKKQVEECCEHKGYSKTFERDVWKQISQHKRGYRTARIPFLLDAFLFEGERILMDKNYELVNEKILFALIEHLRRKRVKREGELMK